MMAVLLGGRSVRMFTGTLPDPRRSSPSRRRNRSRASRLFPHPPRVRIGRRGGHRRRGDLERRSRVQTARVAERPHDADVDGLAPRRDVPRPLDPRRPMHIVPDPEEKVTVLAQVGKAVFGARRPAARSSRGPDRDAADPRPRREHELRGLPAARELPRRRPVPAPPAHALRGPSRLLERHHRALGLRGAAHHRVQGERHAPDPALRDRRVHVVHVLPARHGEAPQDDQGAGWRTGLVINGFGGIVSGVMTVIIAATKFSRGRLDHPDRGPGDARRAAPREQHYQEAARRSAIPSASARAAISRARPSSSRSATRARTTSTPPRTRGGCSP